MPDTAVHEYRTLFMFGAPNANPRSWGLSLDAFADTLRSQDPDVFLNRDSSEIIGDELTFGFGEDLEGFAQADPDGTALRDCTAEEAAEFALWLRRYIVPETAEIEFNIRPAAEVDLPNRLLPRGDAATVKQALLAYIEDVLAAQERGDM
ncbi:hypothetical protein ACFW9M_04380 [Streptomyces lydicus]|uniref:hypothetical protein n=1 Tax=Streptomyces lydicus TaxID=47763 RepID=UPI0036CBB427